MTRVITTPSDYAWIITRDHLQERYGYEDTAVGVVGPSEAAAEDRDALVEHYDHWHPFALYDDDDEEYVAGMLFWDGDDIPEDRVLLGPLEDYGYAGLGATRITFPGQPGWDIG